MAVEVFSQVWWSTGLGGESTPDTPRIDTGQFLTRYVCRLVVFQQARRTEYLWSSTTDIGLPCLSPSQNSGVVVHRWRVSVRIGTDRFNETGETQDILAPPLFLFVWKCEGEVLAWLECPAVAVFCDADVNPEGTEPCVRLVSEIWSVFRGWGLFQQRGVARQEVRLFSRTGDTRSFR